MSEAQIVQQSLMISERAGVQYREEVQERSVWNTL